MKSFVTKILMLLAVVAIAAGCGGDNKSSPAPQPQPGPQSPLPGIAPTTQYIFKSIKFGVDYVGTIQVINADEWAQQQAHQQGMEQWITTHNFQESQQAAFECAGGSYCQPRLANIRVWFERVCEFIPGVYEDFRRLFVRMYVFIEIPGDNECSEGIQIQENYDFFENATALDGNPNNMIHRGYMAYISGNGNFSFDSQNLNLAVTNIGNGLQGRLGTMLTPPSLYNVNLTLFGRGFGGTSFNNAFGGHCYGGGAQPSYTTTSPGSYVPPPPPPPGSDTNYGPASGGQGSNSQNCHNNGLAKR